MSIARLALLTLVILFSPTKASHRAGSSEITGHARVCPEIDRN